MTGYTVKKSDLSIEGYFHRPAFALLNPQSNLHCTVATFLSDYCLIQGEDIRINQETNPLSNANVTYDLRPFNGFARVSIDRAQLVMLSPHTLAEETITDLSLALLNAVHKEVEGSAYATFLIQNTFHAELEDVDPGEFTKQFVSSSQTKLDSIFGNSVTYYLRQDGPRSHSSVTLDVSSDFSECIFVRTALRYDADKIAAKDLAEVVIEHYNQLLSLVGLESE